MFGLLAIGDVEGGSRKFHRLALVVQRDSAARVGPQEAAIGAFHSAFDADLVDFTAQQAFGLPFELLPIFRMEVRNPTFDRFGNLVAGYSQHAGKDVGEFKAISAIVNLPN